MYELNQGWGTTQAKVQVKVQVKGEVKASSFGFLHGMLCVAGQSLFVSTRDGVSGNTIHP